MTGAAVLRHVHIAHHRRAISLQSPIGCRQPSSNGHPHRTVISKRIVKGETSSRFVEDRKGKVDVKITEVNHVRPAAETVEQRCTGSPLCGSRNCKSKCHYQDEPGRRSFADVACFPSKQQIR